MDKNASEMILSTPLLSTSATPRFTDGAISRLYVCIEQSSLPRRPLTPGPSSPFAPSLSKIERAQDSLVEGVEWIEGVEQLRISIPRGKFRNSDEGKLRDRRKQEALRKEIAPTANALQICAANIGAASSHVPITSILLFRCLAAFFLRDWTLQCITLLFHLVTAISARTPR